MTLTSVIFSVSIPVPVSPIMVFIPWWSTAAGTTAWPAAVAIAARVATSAATTAAAWPPPPVEKIGQTGWKWNKVNLNLCMQCLYPTTKSDPIASALLKDNGVIPVKWEALKLVDLLSVTFLKLFVSHFITARQKRKEYQPTCLCPCYGFSYVGYDSLNGSDVGLAHCLVSDLGNGSDACPPDLSNSCAPSLSFLLRPFLFRQSLSCVLLSPFPSPSPALLAPSPGQPQSPGPRLVTFSEKVNKLAAEQAF